MKLAIFLLTALIIACTKAQSNDTFLPIAIAHEGTEYVAFGSYLYAFSLPDLNTLRQQNYSQSIISFPPISVSNETLYLGDGIDGSFVVNLTSFELSQNPGRVVEGQTISGSLMTLQNEYCVTDSANTTKFCFVGGSPATITKTDANGNNTIELGNYTVTRFMKVDEAAGVLHLTAEYVYGRGGDNAVYWTFPLQGDFQIQTGPLTLNNTFISGCPVAPRGCGVPILLYQDVYNGTLVYLWTIARSGDNSSTFEVHLVTVNNETFTEIFFDDSTYTPTFVTEVESTDSSESESSDVSQSSEDESDSSVASDSGSDIASSDSVTPSEFSPVEKKRFRS